MSKQFRQYYLAENDPAGAAVQFQNALRFTPDDPDCEQDLDLALKRMGQDQAAAPHFQRAASPARYRW